MREQLDFKDFAIYSKIKFFTELESNKSLGFCNYLNSTFSELIGIHETNISRRISKLKKYNYIQNTGNKQNRRLVITKKKYPAGFFLYDEVKNDDVINDDVINGDNDAIDLKIIELQNRIDSLKEKKTENKLQDNNIKKEKKPIQKKKPEKNFEDLKDIDELLQFFEDNRKAGKYKTAGARAVALKLLINYSNNNFIIAKQIIKNSIVSNWTGFFKIKKDFNKPNNYNKTRDIPL